MTNIPQYFIVSTDNGHIIDAADTADEAIDKSWWRKDCKVVPLRETTIAGFSADESPFYKVALEQFAGLQKEYNTNGVHDMRAPYLGAFEQYLTSTINPLLEQGLVIPAIKDLKNHYRTGLATAKHFMDWYRENLRKA